MIKDYSEVFVDIPSSSYNLVRA